MARDVGAGPSHTGDLDKLESILEKTTDHGGVHKAVESMVLLGITVSKAWSWDKPLYELRCNRHSGQHTLIGSIKSKNSIVKDAIVLTCKVQRCIYAVIVNDLY